MRTFNKVKKYTKPLLELDEKITLLDCEMKKTKLGEAIANSTSGLYTITGFARDPAIPPIPEVPPIPAIPPTYEPVDPGPIADPNNFIWPEDQGDGSDPNAAPNIPDILYTTYNGEQVPALRQVEVDHGEGVTPLGLVFHTRAISSQVIGYLTNGGFNLVVQSGVFTTPGPYTPVQQAYLNAWNNRGTSGIFQYSTSKTIYLWGQIDCLFGSCYGGLQYYPSNLTNETTPKADYALYPYELVIPTDANGNTLPNQFITDPGVPEVPGIPGVPGIPEGPPRHIVISRNALGDPDYYPGSISPQGDIAGMGPNQVYPLLDIIRSSPPGPTRNNAIQQLNQWAKPGSKNRELLLQLGVPLEGASLPSSSNQQIAQNQGPSSPVKYEPGMGMVQNQGAGRIGDVRPKPISPGGVKLPGV
jgi:hypothetical protein